MTMNTSPMREILLNTGALNLFISDYYLEIPRN